MPPTLRYRRPLVLLPPAPVSRNTLVAKFPTHTTTRTRMALLRKRSLLQASCSLKWQVTNRQILPAAQAKTPMTFRDGRAAVPQTEASVSFQVIRQYFFFFLAQRPPANC